ncbi:hypothetical protein KC331_g847 [Hortaea werneckii]|nr:hypothetical protein KC331_g847 [Hortaea werneckii]KAI7722338.1 hypothetical protein KC353_g586 [Hortaea werneckii]
MTGRIGRPPGAPIAKAIDPDLGMHLLKSMENLMQATDLAYNNQSVTNFKKFLYKILSNVSKYTNLKGREARNKAPSHIEIQEALDSQDAAVARRIRTPIEELSAEEVRSLGKTEIFARLARYITERLEPRPAKSSQVMELIGWINKQFYSKGIFFQQDAQARIRTIYDAYVQRPNVDGNAEVRDDVSPRLQYFFPASPDLGDGVILRTEQNFPGSLTAFKDRLYARFRFNRQRVVITKLFCHSPEVPANEREVSRDEQWTALMGRNLDLYHLAVIHTYNPTYGQPGDPNELGHIPTVTDQLGSFPAVMEKARQLTPEAQTTLINRARALLNRHTQEAGQLVIWTPPHLHCGIIFNSARSTFLVHGSTSSSLQACTSLVIVEVGKLTEPGIKVEVPILSLLKIAFVVLLVYAQSGRGQ